MSNSFTNIKVLECNRLSSEEVKAGNNSSPALWENKLGSGVEINVGDTIQINQAFISEDGAGDSVIEFKGKELGTTKKVKYTKSTFTGFNRQLTTSNNYEKIEYENIEEPVNLQDNQASISVGYYINANGENYVQLPRKYSANSSYVSDDTRLWYISEASASQGDSATYGNSRGLPYHQVPYYNPASSVLHYVDDDYYFSSNNIQWSLAGGTDMKGESFYKIRNDNSRFQLYVCNENYYTATGSNAAPETYWLNIDMPRVSDRTWIRYLEKIDLEVKAGFNTPSNVADTITNQLKATGKQETIQMPSNTENPYFRPTLDLTTFLESKVYKPFQAHSYLDFQSNHYDEFNVSTTGSAPTQNIIDYINTTNFIGIKRPNLWDKGRDVAFGLQTELNLPFNIFYLGSPQLNEDIVDTTSTLIKTNIPFTRPNLELLRDLFIEQGNHEELFTNQYNDYGNGSRTQTTINNSRFLHINPYNACNTERLGTDDVSNASGFFDDSVNNYISHPIFFFYDPANATTFTEGASFTGEDGPCFGFGLKETISASLQYINFYIGEQNASGLHPTTQMFQHNSSTSGGGTDILKDTRIGWDTHFTAYGTCCVALCDGYVKTPIGKAGYDNPYWTGGVNTMWGNGITSLPNTLPPNGATGVSPLNIEKKVRKRYVGANEPLVSFDNVSNRFTISQLHTPEFIGNKDQAGSGSFNACATTSQEIQVEVNSDAGNKVYKINKRNNATNWTPALIPYSQQQVVSTSGTESYNLDVMNYNMTPYAIFDSQSGIIIEDFGFNEDDWGDGLWGIMGFSYNQFNTTESSENDITQRITERNANALPYAYTNADVSATDTINFKTNGWGVPLYNAMLPTSFLWNGTGQNTYAQTADGTRTGFQIENHPPITEIQTSIQLVATNLPRKMLRPYYCIRSDIIDDTHYLGGADSGTNLPVVAIVNKINGYGDYYFADTSDLIFTATKKKTITSIKTSIHSPDQTLARVNRDSAVIYKITSNQPAQTNILQQVMEANQKKK